MAYTQQFPQIVIFHEKHGDLYYLATNTEEYEKIFLQVLTQRYEQKEYEWMNGYVPYGLADAKRDYSSEDINKLPEAMRSEADAMRVKLKKYQDMLKQQRNILVDYVAIKQTVQTKDGKYAYSLLRDFSEKEYERFSIETPIPITV